MRRLPARRKEPLVDRRLRLLDLEEERIVVGAAVEEGDERAEPDAADADDLEGDVDDLVPVEQDPPVLLEAVAVAHR